MDERKKEILMGVVLGVVVLSAVGMSVYGLIKGPSRKSNKLTFECTQCQHQFEMAEADLTEAAYERDGFGAPPRLDCPSCNAQGTALRMHKCPICEQFYYQDPNQSSEQVICGKCGGNITEYIMKQGK